MKLINADKFLQDMADLYRQAGWDEREVHFSLADLRSNIGMEDVTLIPRREPDTVPVIRCKECKYWGKSRINYNEYVCYWGGYVKQEDDFCSWAVRAERKEE